MAHRSPKHAYHRLLIAEPALRRAVPTSELPSTSPSASPFVQVIEQSRAEKHAPA